MNQSTIISKVWSYSNVLRDDGVGYGDYLEQLTYLIFLKMAHEYSKAPFNRVIDIPDGFGWESLTIKSGKELDDHYKNLLDILGQQKGTLGQIFVKSQNKVQDPAKLYKIIQMIDSEKWVTMGADVKGDIYEGLLEKNAEDTKSGAGQYFTPRPLIKAMVACIQPEQNKSICDPACGTGGFFLASYDYLVNKRNLDRDQKEFLKHKTFSGNEIVANTRRLCLMNMFLHNIGEIDQEPAISANDALINSPEYLVDYVMTNPPFGKKSSYSVTNDEGEQEREDINYNRQDFWSTSSNKQLNFVQHIYTLLKNTGKAAVVVPDNVLFEGGAGETVRKKLLQNTELHTILRLPTGVFYKQGVKANVIFFDNGAPQKDPLTKEIWIYDFRTNIHFTLKKNPLKFDDLKEFISCYNPENRHKRSETYSEDDSDGRWRKFTYDEIIARDKTSLDIFWVKDKSLTDLDNLPDPDILALEIVENLEAGLENFKEIIEVLKSN